ncbi:MAG TPA: hypothetical protein VKR53_18845 [Puia sp.]|nr:hypothetical protein [Puia sp.]
MKRQINEILYAFNKLIILLFLIFAISCQKGNNQNPAQTANLGGPNIIYTAIIPDSVILDLNSQRQYNLDLNNDGIIDFVFTETADPSTDCRASNGITYSGDVKPSSASNNAIVYDGAVPRPLDSLTVIDANSSWTKDSANEWLYSNTIGPAAKCDPPGGPWDYAIPANQYLGLKFIKNGNTYYAWARISKGIDATSLMLQGYAYDIIPNQQILAGQTK